MTDGSTQGWSGAAAALQEIWTAPNSKAITSPAPIPSAAAAAESYAWPVTQLDTYRGPWNASTSPILVIGNTVDPATPLRNSVVMAHQLANARLLVVDGYGHTEFLNPSTCAAN